MEFCSCKLVKTSSLHFAAHGLSNVVDNCEAFVLHILAANLPPAFIKMIGIVWRNVLGTSLLCVSHCKCSRPPSGSGVFVCLCVFFLQCL